MKNLKQIVFSFLFILTISVYSYGQVYEKGIEITDSLFKISGSSELLEAYVGSSSSVMDYYNDNKDNFSKSKLVECYEFSFSFEDILEMMMVEYGGNDSLKEYFSPMRLSSIVFALFGMDSTETVLNAIFQNTVVFDCADLKDTLSLIYIFENSYPILVTFIKGEDNAVLATANFIYKKNLINCSKKELKSTVSIPYVKTDIKKYSEKKVF